MYRDAREFGASDCYLFAIATTTAIMQWTRSLYAGIWKFKVIVTMYCVIKISAERLTTQVLVQVRRYSYKLIIPIYVTTEC